MKMKMKMKIRSRSRLFTILYVLILFVVATVWNYLHFQGEPDFNAKFKAFQSLLAGEDVLVDDVQMAPAPHPKHIFWFGIFDILEQGKLNLTETDDPIKYIPKEEQIRGDVLTKDVLLSKTEVSPEVILELQRKHRIVKNQLPLWMGETYNGNTNGIVMIGGKRYSWLAYLGLMNLRDTGCTLPVEFVLPEQEDYELEREFCDTVLPKMNARCVVLPEVLGDAVFKKFSPTFKLYQLKALALVVSSFQNVLLLDSDNMMLQNPEKLFTSEVFIKNGMVTWPDYWQRTISPIFYEVSDTTVNENRQVRHGKFDLGVPDKVVSNIQHKPSEKSKPMAYHDLEGTIPNLSTESGQVLVNKATHACTLLMAMYYNVLGPNFYYKLFSLGQMGEGDKDTFPAAANVCHQNFYQVKSYIRTLGYFDNGAFQGVAMGQKDPVSDFKTYKKHIQEPSKTKKIQALPIEDQIKRIKKIDDEHFLSEHGKLMTLHCNNPKLDPKDLISMENLYDAEKKMLKHHIYNGFMYTNEKGEEVLFELQMWRNMKKAVCDEAITFVHYQDSSVDELCEVMRNQVEVLEAEQLRIQAEEKQKAKEAKESKKSKDKS